MSSPRPLFPRLVRAVTQSQLSARPQVGRLLPRGLLRQPVHLGEGILQQLRRLGFSGQPHLLSAANPAGERHWKEAEAPIPHIRCWTVAHLLVCLVFQAHNKSAGTSNEVTFLFFVIPARIPVFPPNLTSLESSISWGSFKYKGHLPQINVLLRPQVMLYPEPDFGGECQVIDRNQEELSDRLLTKSCRVSGGR